MTAGDIEWQGLDVPMSRRYGDPYFARSDGLAESRHVFLAGNGLPDRFAEGFHIAELGFGTGLNFVAAWQAWRCSGRSGPLRFTSFEASPLVAEEMARALARWADIADLARDLCVAWRGPGAYDLGDAHLSVIHGDARRTLPQTALSADAWFLDGFSPARNPEMWEPGLLQAVHARTAPGGGFATYSAAGHVRRSLAAAGFVVAKRPGFGAKREMCVGSRPIDMQGIAPVA